MMRKGPDGKTIRGNDESADDATRKVPRRSIRDRLLAQDEATEDVPPTHLATAPTNDSAPGNAPPRPPALPEDETPPTVYASAPVPREPPPLPKAPPPAAAPDPAYAPTRDFGPERDYIPADAGATKIYRPNRPAPAPDAPGPAPAGAALSQAGRPRADGPVSADFTIADPVVGWLVVVEGPGRGASLNIGYGNNRVGRAPTENISLDFGDEEISRENHATLTFDGRHRRFYMLPGQGRNLVYVNDQPVMTPIELTGGEEILLGQTKLRFVPFCGKTFDWYQK
jgi:hypothetical protein